MLTYGSTAGGLSQSEQDRLTFVETQEGEILLFGIIDVLTAYTRKKVAEHFCCGTIHCCADISCQPPEQYAERCLSN